MLTMTYAQLAANRANAEKSTGPRTDEGKAASSRNGLTFGLFTMRDFVQPGEEDEEYVLLCAAFHKDLNPQTTLEQTYAAAIISAQWRLRRCSLVESGMSGFFALDPMEDAVGVKVQTSVDRARSQAFNMLRRSTDQLRRLQSDRALRQKLAPAESDVKDLVSYQQIVSTLAHAKRGKLLPVESDGHEMASDCKPFAPTPRNAPCPCGSGEKHKRCCGKEAPPVLGEAA
jgi:hypothetical protein